jgi:hypothetical protein
VQQSQKIRENVKKFCNSIHCLALSLTSIVSRVCRVRGLSCPGFVVSRVCRVQGLSVQGLSVQGLSVQGLSVYRTNFISIQLNQKGIPKSRETIPLKRLLLGAFW